MNMTTIVLALVIVVLVGILGMTQFTGFMTAKSAQVVPDVQQPSVQYTADEDPATPERDITIQAIKGGFEPANLVVKKGDTVHVKLHLKDIDPKTDAQGKPMFTAHGFAIKEFGVNQKVSVDQDTEVTFVADKEGSFPYYCSVFCGEGHIGQAGVLTVQ